MLDIQVQILIQCGNSLLRSAIRISFIDFRKARPCCEIQIGITEHRGKFNRSCRSVYADNELYIGIGASTYSSVTAIYTENGNSPVALHLLLLSYINILVLYIFYIKLYFRLNIHVSHNVGCTENKNQCQDFNNGKQQNLLPAGFFLFFFFTVYLVQLFLNILRRIDLQNIQMFNPSLSFLLFLGKSHDGSFSPFLSGYGIFAIFLGRISIQLAMGSSASPILL